MPTSCAAYKCTHRSDRKAREQGITFHCFPKDLKRRKEWAYALKYQVNGKIWVPEHKTYLCSEHFTEECFDRTGQTTRLRDGAVPSIFDFPPHMKKKVSVSGQRRREKQQLKNATKSTTSVPKGKTLTAVGSSQKVLDVPDSTLTANLSEAAANNKLTLASKDNTTVNNVVCKDLNAKKSAMGCESNTISTRQSSSLAVAVSPNLSLSSDLLQEEKSCKMRKQICATSQISPTIREDSSSQHEKVSGKLQNSDDRNEQPQRLKKVYIVASHPRSMLHNLALLWKDGKFCDAGIGNENATIMVHKVVLLAMCPKLLSMPSADISSSQFLRVNFPKRISQLALDAFADYMYNGILDVDPQILTQLRTVAVCLEMEELKLLCDTHLSKLKSPRVQTTCESNVAVDTVNETLSWTCCSDTKSSSPSVQSTLGVKLSTTEPLSTSSSWMLSPENPVPVSDQFEENHSPSSYLPSLSTVTQPGVTMMDVSAENSDTNPIVISNPDTQTDDMNCATSDPDVSNINNTSVPVRDSNAVTSVIDSTAAVNNLGVVISGLDVPVSEASSVTITNSGVTVTDLGVVINNLNLPITDLCVPVTNLGIAVTHADVTDLGTSITHPGVIDPCDSIKNLNFSVADSCINVTAPHVTVTTSNDNDVNQDSIVTNLTVPVVDVVNPVDNPTDPSENVTGSESSITHQEVGVSDPDTNIINPSPSITDSDTNITNLQVNVCDPATVTNMITNDIDLETNVVDPGAVIH
ncbi:XP_029645012.1uncharacterized protein LOC115219085 isoform X2 [Octopus vulgaris]|uniref:XP_029645012.1uncharacterized protein LOC115219085 isoform X2 n=1 Tax=Octopus vulgaris TaxID=6645 RepID=A0AA36FCZ3_OCTVU|nr:XP_029645012.1uncharacterized protein LOC115219085 isoform X2 [Octopus vulgaris]